MSTFAQIHICKDKNRLCDICFSGFCFVLTLWISQLDSIAFFPYLSWGANNELAGIATLMAVLETIGKLKQDVSHTNTAHTDSHCCCVQYVLCMYRCVLMASDCFCVSVLLSFCFCRTHSIVYKPHTYMYMYNTVLVLFVCVQVSLCCCCRVHCQGSSIQSSILSSME